MENETKEITKVEEPLIITDGLLTDDVIKRAELQVDGLNKIKEISLKLTNKLDWFILNGKPCLQNSGCMKIANLWGVSFHKPSIVEEKKTDERGEYILFTASGEAEFRGRVVNDIGTSTTRDKLLGSVGGNLRPLADIDLQSVKKMSITNWQSRILRKILGLSFEMADLEKKGVKTESQYNHASGGAGGGLISDAQRKRMYAIAKSEGKATDEQLKAYLKDKYGIEHSADVKVIWYEAICDFVKDPKNWSTK